MILKKILIELIKIKNILIKLIMNLKLDKNNYLDY